VLANGGDMVGVGVAQGDVVAGPDHVRAEGPADRARADDGDVHARAPSRKSRTVDRNSSRSSIWGEWPDFSKTTSFAFGIRSAIVCDALTGVTQSRRPTVTSVGAVTAGSCGLRS